MFNQASHRNIDKVEAVWQTQQRYKMAGASILAEMPDVACLQECETDFFSEEYNEHAAQILARFTQHRFDDEPGTVVLLKRDGKLKQVDSEDVLRLGGSDSCGGSSKSTVCLPVETADGFKTWICSTHFTWDGAAEKRLHHIGIIEKALTDTSIEECVVVGDFNADLKVVAGIGECCCCCC
jgi:endonuclease/exonuclease/phosphatase family metal-dependent hydrolase